MNRIIDDVMASRRLRIFTAGYAIVYIAITLIMNLLHTYIPFFGTDIGRLVYVAASAVVQAPMLYGLVRGIVKKNYHFAEGLSAYTEVKNYGAYCIHIAIIVAYEIVYFLVEMIGRTEGAMSGVAQVLAVVLIVVRLLLNCFLVKFYFDCIDRDGKTALSETFKGFINAVKTAPGKIIAAEVFLIVVQLVSLLISSMLANLIPEIRVVSFIIACINEVRYGFIIIAWPVYYLYYRYIFE